MSEKILLQNADDFDNFIKSENITVVHFSAPWSEGCKQLQSILEELEAEHKTFELGTIDAEKNEGVSRAYNIIACPTVLFFQEGRQIDRHDGFNPAEIKNKILKNSFGAPNLQYKAGDSSSESLDDKLKRLINTSRLMLFMKGTPEVPRCGFSRQMVELLNGLHVGYKTFDILEDEEVRQGLKEFSKWPTYPQLYLDGELLGGLDVVREEIKKPGFVEKLPKLQNVQ